VNRILTAILAGALLTAVPAVAQSKKDKNEDAKTRSVQGVVMDGQDNPIEGAVVQLKDTRSLQIRSFITRQNGSFHFHGLNREIDYELKADHQGKSSDSRRLSSFDSRSQAVMNLKIEK
jgi:hypothetical protein